MFSFPSISYLNPSNTSLAVHALKGINIMFPAQGTETNCSKSGKTLHNHFCDSNDDNSGTVCTS